VTGYFAGNQIMLNLPKEADWVVLDAPAGLQGYKLNDTLRAVDKILIPGVPSIFDMAATEDFLSAIRPEKRRKPRIPPVGPRPPAPAPRKAGRGVGDPS